MVFLHNAHLIIIILFNIYVVRYKTIPSRKIEGGNNRVILATDGDLNVGITSEGELTELIEEKRDSGVYIDSLLEAKKVLVEELGGTLYTVAKDGESNKKTYILTYILLNKD